MTERWSIHHGDVLDRLPELEAGSFDAVLCDPPYGIRFMGRAWDHGVPGEPVWSLVREALKPGAHLLAFGGTRTEHRLVCAIEDAGFEIRDKVMWLHGVGFPKSHNFGCKCKVQCNDASDRSVRGVRNLDNEAAEPVCEQEESDLLASVQRGSSRQGLGGVRTPRSRGVDGIEPTVVSEEDDRPEQPSMEGRGHIPQASGQLQERSVCEVSGELRVNGSVGRVCDGASAGGGSRNGAGAEANGVRASHQPRSAGQSVGKPDAVRQQSGSQTVRASRRASADLERCPDCGGLIRFHGYGTALKPAYEPCVVAMKPLDGTFAANAAAHGVAGLWIDGGRVGTTGSAGRWPSNLILDAEAAAMLDAQSGVRGGGKFTRSGVRVGGKCNHGVGLNGAKNAPDNYGDTGGASRFFYTSKASTRERNAGLEDLPDRIGGGLNSTVHGDSRTGHKTISKNNHPTLKPIDLCRYLATLILPPKRDTPRRLLVPFSGSGSEMIGALLAGWDEVVGIEREREYIDIAERRLAHWCASSEEEADTTLFAESA